MVEREGDGEGHYLAEISASLRFRMFAEWGASKSHNNYTHQMISGLIFPSHFTIGYEGSSCLALGLPNVLLNHYLDYTALKLKETF